MGARLLRSWVLRPEISLEEIEERLDAVAELKSHTVAREEIRKEIEGILDLERLTSRITLGSVTPRDLLALRGSLEKLPQVRELTASVEASCATFETQGQPSADRNRAGRLENLRGQIDEMTDVRDLIARAIADDPPAMANEPGVIRRGFHAELDELRDITKQGRQIIAAMEERERKRTGIASLKIRYNQIFGYYIEVSKANLHLAPADYERKQTLVNAERFTSGELKEHERKVLSAEERVLEIERRLYGEIREAIAREASRLRRTADGHRAARRAGEFRAHRGGAQLHASRIHAGIDKAQRFRNPGKPLLEGQRRQIWLGHARHSDDCRGAPPGD